MTPPVGLCLLVSAKIAGAPTGQVVRVLTPWFATAAALLLGVTYLPMLLG